MKEQVFQLSRNKWQVYSMTSFSTTVVCDRTVKPIMIDFSTIIELDPGCKLRLQSHLLYAEHEDEITMSPMHFSWSWNASTLFSHTTQVKFSAALQSLQDYGLHVVDAADIAHHLKFNSFTDDIPSDITSLFSKPFNILSIILTLLIIIIIIVFAYRYYFRIGTKIPLNNTSNPTANDLFPYKDASAPSPCPIPNICYR